MNLLLKNGRVIDPSQKIDAKLDILIEKGKIVEIGHKLDNKTKDIIDLSGKIICPGFLDIHVHLREPGYEYKETIKTGSYAAAHGGFTSIACMPNTNPVADNQEVIRFITSRAKEEGIVNVFPVGAISKGLKGEELTEMGELFESGVKALSDDGKCIQNADLIRRAFEYAKLFDLNIISHCEDFNLSKDGMINEGFISTKLGLIGIPKAAEEVIVARDIQLAEFTKSKLHIAHISSFYSVELVRNAKKRGVNVTAEVTPHHLVLDESLAEGYDTNTKVNPPLRGEDDRVALVEGLRDGTIDCIASDHAPHARTDKEVEYDRAAFGIAGLETSISVILSELVHRKKITLTEMVEKFTLNPSRVLNLDKGILQKGKKADITVLDLEKESIVNPDLFFSKGRNTPFAGWKVKGMPVMTIVNGEIVMQDGRVKEKI
ncbi:MAG: dihydroorotase [bacterium]